LDLLEGSFAGLFGGKIVDTFLEVGLGLSFVVLEVILLMDDQTLRKDTLGVLEEVDLLVALEDFQTEVSLDSAFTCAKLGLLVVGKTDGETRLDQNGADLLSFLGGQTTHNS